MPTGLSTDQGFIGSGDLMAKNLRDSAGGFRPVGNASLFQLTPKVQELERKSFQRATRGQVLDTYKRLDGIDLRIEVDTFGRENLALALAGADADFTQAELTDQSASVTLYHGQWVEIGAHNISALSIDATPASFSDWTETSTSGTYDESGSPLLVGAGTVTDDWTISMTSSTEFSVSGTATGALASGSIGEDYAPENPASGLPYFTLAAAGWGGTWSIGETIEFSTTAASGKVEGTDYLFKPESGMVLALASGTIADGTACTVTYNAPAISDGYAITGGSQADALLQLRLDGYDEVSGKSVITDVWRVRVSPLEAFNFITGDFNKLVLTGSAETPEGQTSPLRTRVLPGMS